MYLLLAAPWLALGANVLPILPGDKKPAVAGWASLHSLDSPKLTADVIGQWSREFADCNAAVLPATIDATVVDVDRPELLEAVLAACGPTEYRTASPREGGGVHLWYRGASRSRNAITPGVDVKSIGGYVIAPGSLHAKTGQPYVASPALAAALAAGQLDLPRPRDGWRERLAAIGETVLEPSRFDLRALADRLISGRTHRGLGQVLGRLAKGEAFADPGERESAIYHVVRRMAEEWPHARESAIVGLFEDSARVMERLAPVDVPILDQVRSKWSRFAADATATAEATRAEDDRPVVELSGADDRQILSAIADALADKDAAARSGLMLQGSGLVVHDPRAARIIPATADRVAVALAEAIAFRRDGGPCTISGELARKVAARPPDLPTLVEVRAAPILRSDGSIRCEQGLDPTTQVWCDGWPGLPITAGTREDAAAAMRRLFRFVDVDQWDDPGSAIAWLAHALTVAARPAIDGPVPTWIYSAPASGSGKTALARAAGIVGGRCDSVATPGDLRDEAELARALDDHAGRPAVVLDNLHGTFRSPLLESVVSGGGGLTVRRLYVGPVVVPWRCVLSISSNGATIGHDWSRRSLGVRLSGRRLDAGRDLVEDARCDTTLTDDAVGAMAAWLRSGEQSEATPLAGFLAWSSMIAGAIRWALGYDVVPMTRDATASMVAAEDDGAELLDRISVWLASRGSEAFKISELWDSPTFFDLREEHASRKALSARLGRLSDGARVLASRSDVSSKCQLYYIRAR